MSRLEAAAERVAAFLQERTKLTAIDPDVVYKVNHEELLTDDLLALVEAAHFMRVMLGINASARIEYAAMADGWDGPEVDEENRNSLQFAQENVQHHNNVRESQIAKGGKPWPLAFVMQRLVTDWEPKQ
ncbi:hypothetical protein SONNY_61 [Arthrobacter phage Sonny]|uniref:Uncharacterized protein n=2 Tax=Marthavirus shade TaxID=2560306 RepID=A0A0U3TMN9_9CAUD|nr:hypothetical protein FDH50_gp61 [Arthrobacter phage Sonny]YP_009612515.1 hypothetical protein FDI42_gp62 [Arthrobacter phage Shade]ALY10329.1 hypothetical protein SONNY_61 [Arthrobacter phage Sonny]ASR80767.1 hypothetical protein SEA_SHADE_62 [Arthrobacter phage Shade]